MSQNLVCIRELAGWGLDPYEFRPQELGQAKLALSTEITAQRPRFEQSNSILARETEQLSELFKTYNKRPDLLSEMSGLSWSLGVADLRNLIAFQRRLAFTPDIATPFTPTADDWPALCALSFGTAKLVEYEMIHLHEAGGSTQTFILQSANPDLHLRVTGDPTSPFSVHAGGAFFEVACFRGRWFLRDGYHRAFALLQAGVYEVPAVIVQASTLEELGANGPWFFPEDVLFSTAPPRVIDFLNDELVLEYERVPVLKRISIQIEQTLMPVT